VFVDRAGMEKKAGDVVKVKVEAAEDYDLRGVVAR